MITEVEVGRPPYNSFEFEIENKINVKPQC